MRDKAITELYQDKLFLSMCKKYGKENSEELRSEVVSILLEMPGDKLTHIIENGYLLPYSINIVRLQSISKRDSFNKKFNNELKYAVDIDYISNRIKIKEDFDLSLSYNDILYNREMLKINKLTMFDPYEIDDTEERHLRGHKLLNKINSDSLDQNNEHFYGSRLVLLKVEKGSIKAVSRATGIPYRSMQDALKKYITHLREWQKK